MALDKATREAIAASVRKATIEMQEVYQEQWVSGKQLCEEVGLFTEKWLKTYGDRLPRECLRVRTQDGVEHKTGWAYPKKKILRMIHDGELRMMMV